MLTYNLGWSRPDKGLDWWLSAGKPTEDLRLRLFDEVWERDGHLGWFLAWLVDGLRSSPSPLHEFCHEYDREPVRIDERWVRGQLQESLDYHAPVPKELHPESHYHYAVSDPASSGRICVSSKHLRTATFVTDSMYGWYRALANARKYLPNPDHIDWKVDVFVRPVGWLGTYRRSWKTGLWFAGKHRFHEVGN